jgi:lysozyme
MSIAVDFIKEAEGLRLKSYRDSGGVLTIGWGHTGPDVTSGMTITEDRAEVLLANDMRVASDAVAATVTVPITENQLAILTSLTLNIGTGGWRRSTVLRRLNNKNYAGAADAMLMWNKVRNKTTRALEVNEGLVNRRERERDLFLANMPPEVPPPIRSSQPVANGDVVGGEAKPLRESKTQWLGMSGILTAIIAAWSQLRTGAPELVTWAVPYLPYIFGLIFAAVLLNRWWDSKKGIN